jgi:4-hydroxy-tetrahydrodipicolinate reductase
VTRVAIIGVTGRMGRALVRAAQESTDLNVVAGVASAKSADIGTDIGTLAAIGPTGVLVTSDLRAALAQCDVAIDFSNATATSGNVQACTAARKPVVIGTTGVSSEVDLEITEAARHIAVLVAPNTSFGVTLLIELVRAAAKALPADFDIEISEAHHRNKRDAPSGTWHWGKRRPKVARRMSRRCRQSRDMARVRGARARSVSRSRGAGTSSGITRCCSPGPGSRSCSVTGRPTGRSLPAERSRRRPGLQVGRRGGTGCATWWVTKQGLRRERRRPAEASVDKIFVWTAWTLGAGSP